ncbi:MAG: MFS transporter, partial [Planctomycetota bacterium]
MKSALSRGVNVFMFARAAPFYARYTIRHHMPAELLLGSFAGVIQLCDLVSRKTLNAPDWVIAWQASVPMMTFVLAMVWRDLLEDRDRKKTLIFTGLFGKGIFLLAAFVVLPTQLLTIVIAWALVDSAFIPLKNTIFRANYDDRVRGRFFGGVVSLTNLTLVIANLGAAYLLTRWEWTYRILLPAAAVAGIAAHVIYSRVRVRGEDRGPARERSGGGLRTLYQPFVRGFTTTIRILKEDRDFRAYEVNFFIYGMAFLMNLPLVVFLIVDEIELP